MSARGAVQVRLVRRRSCTGLVSLRRSCRHALLVRARGVGEAVRSSGRLPLAGGQRRSQGCRRLRRLSVVIGRWWVGGSDGASARIRLIVLVLALRRGRSWRGVGGLRSLVNKTLIAALGPYWGCLRNRVMLLVGGVGPGRVRRRSRCTEWSARCVGVTLSRGIRVRGRVLVSLHRAGRSLVARRRPLTGCREGIATARACRRGCRHLSVRGRTRRGLAARGARVVAILSLQRGLRRPPVVRPGSLVRRLGRRIRARG